MTYFYYASYKDNNRLDDSFVLSYLIPLIRNDRRVNPATIASYAKIVAMDIPASVQRFSLGPKVLHAAIGGKTYLQQEASKNNHASQQSLQQPCLTTIEIPDEIEQYGGANDLEHISIEDESPEAPKSLDIEIEDVYEAIREGIQTGKSELLNEVEKINAKFSRVSAI